MSARPAPAAARQTSAHESEVGTLIAALLSATPEPPGPDADPAVVIDTAAAMLAARQELCGRLAALDPATRLVPPSAAADHARLVERDARWEAALSSARGRLGDQLRGARRLRDAR